MGFLLFLAKAWRDLLCPPTIQDLGLEVGHASPRLQSCQVQVPGSSQVLFLLELCIPRSPWLGAPTPSRAGGTAAASGLCWQPGTVEGAGMCHGTVTCPTAGPCSPPLCQGGFAVSRRETEGMQEFWEHCVVSGGDTGERMDTDSWDKGGGVP